MIDLLRHGATTVGGRYLGHTDVPLSAAGLAAMEHAVQDGCWHRVVTSPLQRCAAFAMAYAERQGLPCDVDACWMELDFGDWDNRSVAAIHDEQPQALGAFWRDPQRHPPPGGESIDGLRTRVLAAMHRLRGILAPDERALVVTHGGPIRLLLAERDGLPLHRLLEIDVPHAALVRLAD